MRLAVIDGGKVGGVYEGESIDHILDLYAQDKGYKDYTDFSRDRALQTEIIVSDMVSTTLGSLPMRLGPVLRAALKASNGMYNAFELPCDPGDYEALEKWATEAKCQVEILGGRVSMDGETPGAILGLWGGEMSLEQARELVGLDDRRSSNAQGVMDELADDPELKDISIETVSAILAACGINNEIDGGSILLECVEVGGNTVKRIDRPPIDIDDIRVDAHRLKTEPGV